MPARLPSRFSGPAKQSMLGCNVYTGSALSRPLAREDEEAMIGETIGFLLRNLPILLFVAAIALALSVGGYATFAERLLSWTLLLPIGVTGLWAGVSYSFRPSPQRTLDGRSVRSSSAWQTSRSA